MDWYLGTMGFGYKDWEGVFYPPGLPSRNYLGHFSRFFNSVELDTTFYGPPTKSQISNWRQNTPADFLFCLKTPRQITHNVRLKNAAAETKIFLQRAALFEDQLGVILIQLPPDFTPTELPALAAFLSSLPSGFSFAVEFRHPAWYTSSTADLLAASNVCWATTEYLDLPTDIVVTTSFLYIRWIGAHGRYPRHDFERVDLSPRLQMWYQWLLPHLPQVDRVYGFFNNDYAGHSPATLNRFRAIVGLPVKDLAPPQQGRLF